MATAGPPLLTMTPTSKGAFRGRELDGRRETGAAHAHYACLADGLAYGLRGQRIEVSPPVHRPPFLRRAVALDDNGRAPVASRVLGKLYVLYFSGDTRVNRG